MPTPDIANYMARITEIQRGIISESTAKSFAYTVPQINPPYWVNEVSAMPASRQNTGVSNNLAYIEWQITITMTLIRGNATEGEPGLLETQCYEDMTATLQEFASNRELVTTTYPQPQAGFIISGVPQISVQGLIVDASTLGTRYQYTIIHTSRGS